MHKAGFLTIQLMFSFVSVKDDHTAHLLTTVQTYQQVSREGRLLQIDFTSLVDYLHLLRACSLIIAKAGKKAMLYLAAAVSDFYIPRDKMVMIAKDLTLRAPKAKEIFLNPKRTTKAKSAKFQKKSFQTGLC